MNKNMRVEDSVALVPTVTQWILDRLHQSIRQKGTATIALAGGSTPKAIYQAISQAQFPWDKLHVFWGDERFVPPTHTDSNELMARDNWLNQVAIPTANIHPWPTEIGTPEQCADSYGLALQSHFQTNLPTFDLVLLGMGEDGHTASLFPHSPALNVADKSTTVGSKDGQPRLTLTAAAINNSACVAFIVTGAGKRPALQQVMNLTISAEADHQYPARLIAPAQELWWWLDTDAAAEISQL
jgi:6-phosphogluconolactonase